MIKRSAVGINYNIYVSRDNQKRIWKYTLMKARRLEVLSDLFHGPIDVLIKLYGLIVVFVVELNFRRFNVWKDER